MSPRRPLDVRALIASGAIEAQLVPSLWRGLLAWLLGPSPFSHEPTVAQTTLPVCAASHVGTTGALQ